MISSDPRAFAKALRTRGSAPGHDPITQGDLPVTNAAALKAWATRRADPDWQARRAAIDATKFNQLVELAELVAGASAPTHGARQGRIDERRAVLSTIVRRAGPQDRKLGPAVMDADETEDEHVVPVRIIIERLIMRPHQARALLSTALLGAVVTKDEHSALGGVNRFPPGLYERMKRAAPKRLPELGLERYEAADIDLIELPRLD